MTRWLVIIAAALDHPTVVLERAVYLALVGVTTVQLVRALADLDGVELSPPLPEQSDSPGPAREALVAFQEDIDNVVRPVVDDPQAALRLQLSSHYFAHLLAADAAGARLRGDELADLADHTGTPIGTLEQGRQALASMITSAADNELATLEVLWRSGQRATQLWPRTQAKAMAAPHELLTRRTLAHTRPTRAAAS